MQRRFRLGLAFALAASGLVVLATPASAAPTTLPDITAPTTGTTLQGVLTVTAQTSAPKVKFTLSGAMAWRAVAVTANDGLATAEVETYGLDGVVSVKAQDCTSDLSCNSAADTVNGLTVANPPIVIDEPTSLVRLTSGNPTTQITAHADGGGRLRIVAGSGEVALDAGSVSGQLSASGLSDGVQYVRVERCGTDDLVCGQSVRVPVERWYHLYPRLLGWNIPITPDGNHIGDVAHVNVYYQGDKNGPNLPTRISWTMLDSNGNEVIPEQVVGTDLNSTTPVGFPVDPYALIGHKIPAGSYTVRVQTQTTIDGTPVSGSQNTEISVTYAGPPMSRPRVTSGTPYYPARDGFRDYLRATVDIPVDEFANVEYQILNASGRVVAHGFGQDPQWDGNNAKGRVVSEGRYRVRFTATNWLGNTSTATTPPFLLSHKKLQLSNWQRTVSAKSSLVKDRSGRCSSLATPGTRRWAGSVGYLSDDTCKGVGRARKAVGIHRVRLPAHLMTEQVRVEAFGATRPGADALSRARLYPLRPHGAIRWSLGYHLDDAPRWYRTDWMPPTYASTDGGLRWAVTADKGGRYVVKSFRIKVRHWVLR